MSEYEVLYTLPGDDVAVDAVVVAPDWVAAYEWVVENHGATVHEMAGGELEQQELSVYAD